MSIADLMAKEPRGWYVTSKGFGEYAVYRPGTTEHKAKGLVFAGTIIKEHNGYIVYGAGAPKRVKSEAGVFSHLKKQRTKKNPGRDGTGPTGKGPRTGRGAGGCKKNPVSKKRKTVRFYYNDGYMGYRIWSPTARAEASSWLRNNGRYPDKYSVKIGNKTYRSMKALP